jgi:Tol biopolymer transport system component
MGEVWRARDTRLGREVAIKVLPAELASEPDRLKRFEREAWAASSLNHPNVVTIYEIERIDSVRFIAMELVSGKTLREVLAGGPLPTRKLLGIAVQVADGLAKAHFAGIVHRDLKPENVMVTKDGLVKILDFGLAKLAHPELEGEQPTSALTVSEATRPGTVMGTVGYMSPEQAAGHPVDVRSDQFSFGSMLYEMATGTRAFARGTTPETLTAIIREEPEPIVVLNSRVPAPVRWIVERCLAKEPRSRYASTEDLARELMTIQDHLSEAASGAVELAAKHPLPRHRLLWLSAAVTAILAVLGAAFWHLRRTETFWKNPLAEARFTRLTDWEGTEFDADISRDGKFVAFLADREGVFDVWVTQVGGGEFRNLTHGQHTRLANQQVRSVGFSGDGARLWLRIPAEKGRQDVSVWVVPTMGGTERPFLPENSIQAAWSPDGGRVLYFTQDPGDPIFIADRGGGNARQIFVDRPGIHNHYLTWSPDGRFVYFVRGIPTTWDMDIWRIPSTGGRPERVTRHHSRVAYPTFLDEKTLVYTAATGGMYSLSGSDLYAIDVERQIAHRVSFGLEEYISIAASADGRRLVAAVANPTRNLWTVPISDHVAEEAEAARFRLQGVSADAPRFGPGYLLYLSSMGTADGLWSFKEGATTELWRSSEGAVVAAPAVSHDGAQIAFAVRVGEHSRLQVMSADGTNLHPAAESLDVRDAPSWSPDGRWIAVCANEGGANPLFKVPVQGGAPIRLVDGVIFDPVWSPDGRYIIYSESVGGSLYPVKAVTPDGRPFPFQKLEVRYGGNRYRFLPSGKGLVVSVGKERHYLNFWLVDLETQGMRQLTNLKPGFDIRDFDISPDGKQIVFARVSENSDIVLIDRPPH